MWDSSSLVGMDFPGGGFQDSIFFTEDMGYYFNWKLEYFGSHPALSIV